MAKLDKACSYSGCNKKAKYHQATEMTDQIFYCSEHRIKAPRKKR